jgi:hypothetical protein
MTATKLLSELEARGIRLEAREGRLRYFPASAVTPELRETLIAYKTELLGLLQRPRDLHYALAEKPVLGVPIEEPCLVGCGSPVRFYWQEGTGYGYCARCDVHQRIETREM